MFLKKLLFRIIMCIKLWRLPLLLNRRKALDREKMVVYEVIRRLEINTSEEIGNFITNTLKYKRDFILDLQQLAYETIQLGFGDCEDLHRVAQIMYATLNDTKLVFLINVLTDPVSKSHAFVVIYDINEGSWGYINYRDIKFGFHSLESAVFNAMKPYQINRVLDYQLFDLDLRRIPKGFINGT